jgi:hypothetical protein
LDSGFDELFYHIFYTFVTVRDGLDGQVTMTPAVALKPMVNVLPDTTETIGTALTEYTESVEEISILLSWYGTGPADLDLAANFYTTVKKCQVGFFQTSCGNGNLISQSDQGGEYGVELLTISPVTQAAFMFYASAYTKESIADSAPTMYVYIPESRAPVSVTTSSPPLPGAPWYPYWLGICIDGRDLSSIKSLNTFSWNNPQPQYECSDYLNLDLSILPN